MSRQKWYLNFVDVKPEDKCMVKRDYIEGHEFDSRPSKPEIERLGEKVGAVQYELIGVVNNKASVTTENLKEVKCDNFVIKSLREVKTPYAEHRIMEGVFKGKEFKYIFKDSLNEFELNNPFRKTPLEDDFDILVTNIGNITLYDGVVSHFGLDYYDEE